MLVWNANQRSCRANITNFKPGVKNILFALPLNFAKLLSFLRDSFQLTHYPAPHRLSFLLAVSTGDLLIGFDIG